MNNRITLSLLLICFCCAPAMAQSSRWNTCSTFSLLPPSTQDAQKPLDGEIHASADQIESQTDEISKLSGDVFISREFDSLQADEAVLLTEENRFDLFGNVRYRSDNFEAVAQSMTAFTDSEKREINQAYFFMPAEHSNGYADKIIREAQTTYLYDTRYTSCDPDKVDWEFRAKKITLQHDSGVGLARNLSLRFKDVPFFYFPLISFPIDDRRKSGFLLEESPIGYSEQDGFEVITTYYWNIAPQADATIQPHYMRRRGLKLDSEWRLLNRWSFNQLDTEYLDDDIFGDRRSLLKFNHTGRIGRVWTTRVNSTSVSDESYFDDFGGSLSASSITHLPRDARLSGGWRNWNFNSRILTYQTIDESIPGTSRPYRLLPSLTLTANYPEIWKGLDFTLRTNFTTFDQEDRVTANRLDIRPHISRPFGGISWFLTPSIGVRHTLYSLNDLTDPDSETEPSRSVPTFSLDSGLFFERNFGTQRQFLQTLEPRIYYLYTPFRNQDDIPVFDSSVPDFNFAQLFTENRFVGTDRVGDADQFTLSLGSRILNTSNGKELFKANIGQIFYQQERRVTLNGSEPATEDKSDIIAGLEARLGRRWSTHLDLEWNPERQETDKQSFGLRYNRDNNHIINLEYRFREDGLEQTDLSFNWQLSRQWKVVGRWNRSLEEDTDLEKFLGFSYESCCYALRIITREYLVEQDEFNYDIFFELSLKGLTQIGKKAGDFLERGILGYKDTF